MKNAFQIFAGNRARSPEEFQNEISSFKEDVGVARNILRVGARSSYIDFIGGEMMKSMHLDLVRTFPVADAHLARFSADLSIMLGNARETAQGDFVVVAERVKRRGAQHPSSHEWDVLKSNAQQNLREIAPAVIQLWHAARDAQAPKQSLRHNLL